MRFEPRHQGRNPRIEEKPLPTKKTKLATMIAELARKEADDSDSLTSKNSASVPAEFKVALMLFADISAVIVLDQSGRYRAFAHGTAEEIVVSGVWPTIAQRALEEQFPEVAAELDAHLSGQ